MTNPPPAARHNEPWCLVGVKRCAKKDRQGEMAAFQKRDKEAKWTRQSKAMENSSASQWSQFSQSGTWEASYSMPFLS